MYTCVDIIYVGQVTLCVFPASLKSRGVGFIVYVINYYYRIS